MGSKMKEIWQPNKKGRNGSSEAQYGKKEMLEMGPGKPNMDRQKG